MTITDDDRDALRQCSKDDATYARFSRRHRTHETRLLHDAFFLDALQDIVFELDSSGLWGVLTPAWQRVTGFPLAETLGRAAVEFVLPHDRERYHQTFDPLLAGTKTDAQVELGFSTRIGGRCYLDAKARSLVDPDTQQRVVIGVLHDLTPTRNAEAQLDERQTFLDRIAEYAPVAIYVYDLDRRTVVYTNPTYEAMIGFSLTEIQAMGDRYLPRIYHPEDRDRWMQSNAGMVRDEQARQTEGAFRVVRADGAVIWVAVTETILNHRADGTPRQILGIAQDVSAEQRAAARLESGRRNLQTLIENTDGTMWSFDRECRLIVANQKFRDRVRGITGQEVQAGDDLFGFDVPSDLLDTWRGYYDRVLGGETFRVEMQSDLSPEPQVVEYRFSPIRSSTGKVIGATAFGRDITESRQAEETLREARRKYEDLANSITDVFFAMDSSLCYTYWNAACEQLTGIPAVEALGRSLYELFPHSQGTIIDQTYREVLASHQANTFETRFTLHGQERHFENHVYPVVDGLCVISRDVTDRAHAQQRDFELALERERRHLLTHFIQNVAHEFRTPLTIISTSTHLMTRVNDLERQQRKAEIIQRQVRGVSKLVDMLLLMVRLENEMTVSRCALRLDDIAHEVCEALRRQYGEQPRLVNQLSPDLPPLTGNADYLSEALKQILDNAYRFTPPHGTITLSGGRSEGKVWLAVADTGPGIPAADLPHIFESFWRSDAAHSTPGFGLGLPIAQRIMHQHDGHIAVQTSAGHGTTFRLELPACSTSSAA